MELIMKICSKCQQKQRLYEFNKSTKRKDGLQPHCNSCRKEYRIENKEKNKTLKKQWTKNNKKRVLLQKRKWYDENQDRVNANVRQRYHNDIDYKLKVNLRNRLNRAIRNNQKVGSAVSDLGCTIEELKLYLESKFEPWMTWDNWGKHDKDKATWHIDHIKPLSNYDLTDRKELLKACHYNNLQPLLAKDNLSKGSS